MQALLTGKRRFPEFQGQPWKEVRLGELARVNPRTSAPSPDQIVSFIKMEAVTEDSKLVAPVERFFKDVSSGFTQFQNGDVLVAKITPCFENGKGCHAAGLANGRGAGSTEFIVIRALSRSDERFIYHIVTSRSFRGRGTLNMQGSAGQRRLPVDFVRNYKIYAPTSAEERNRVAKLMDTVTTEIALLEANIRLLSAEKKALMQQLLTGKRRVSV